MTSPKYRIRAVGNEYGPTHFLVEMWHFWHWIVIKSFSDEDMWFAHREAEELLDKLMEK